MTDNSPRKDVLIVIPTLNEAAYIGALIALLSKDFDETKGLLIVADGGSTDGTIEIVKALLPVYPYLRFLHNEKRLQSAAINLAAQTFGDAFTYMIRIDAHAGYPEGYIAGLLRAARESQAQSVVVPMVTEGSRCFQKAVAAAQNSVLGTGGSAHRHAGYSAWVDHGHHALFEISWFLKLGGYDESFSHNEDAEYDARLAKAGGKIWLDGNSAIIYFPRRDPKSLFRQYVNYGKGRARTVAKHNMSLKPRQMAPIAILPACLLALVSPLFLLVFSPLFWLVLIPFAVWAGVCLIYGASLSVRQKDTCILFSGPAAMIMHLAWSCGFIGAAGSNWLHKEPMARITHGKAWRTVSHAVSRKVSSWSRYMPTQMGAIRPWIWPGLCAVLLLLGFAIRGSDTPVVATSLMMLTGLLAAVAWLIPVQETPRLGLRPQLVNAVTAFVILCFVLGSECLRENVLLSQSTQTHPQDLSAMVIEFTKLGGIAAAFTLGLRVSLNDKSAQRLLDILLFLGGLWALAAIVMEILDPDGIYGVQKMGVGRLSGAFSSPNSAGMLFGAIVVLSLGRLLTRVLSFRAPNFLERLDLLALSVCLVSLTALLLSLSRGGLMATLISASVMSLMLLWRRLSLVWLAGGFLGVMATLFILFLSPLTAVLVRFGQMDTDARATIFKAHYHAALQHPWLGGGLGSFNAINNAIITPANYQDLYAIRAAHNVYLQWFEETGLLGLLAIALVNLAILVPMIRGARQRERMGSRISAILFAYLVFILHGFTDYGFQEPALAIFIALLLGSGFAIATNSKRQISENIVPVRDATQQTAA